MVNAEKKNVFRKKNHHKNLQIASQYTICAPFSHDLIFTIYFFKMLIKIHTKKNIDVMMNHRFYVSLLLGVHHYPHHSTHPKI